MKLVNDWKKAPKWLSMHAMFYAAAIQGAWVAIPSELQAMVHPVVAHAITAILLVAGMVGRLVQQSPVTPPVVASPSDDNAEHA